MIIKFFKKIGGWFSELMETPPTSTTKTTTDNNAMKETDSTSEERRDVYSGLNHYNKFDLMYHMDLFDLSPFRNDPLWPRRWY